MSSSKSLSSAHLRKSACCASVTRDSVAIVTYCISSVVVVRRILGASCDSKVCFSCLKGGEVKHARDTGPVTVTAEVKGKRNCTARWR